MVRESSASRKSVVGLTQEAFEQLLAWLDKDRDRAGERYEDIRLELIRAFQARRCMVPEDLADETIDRVARKVRDISDTYIGDPALYFYGVARMVYLEYLRSKRDPPSTPPFQAVEDEHKYECLRRCIDRLTPRNRELILAYYREGEQPNADWRKELAQKMGLEPNAMWVRVHRIREQLRECVGECLKNRQTS